MTERTASDNPADAAADVSFEHVSADVAPELFPAEPTVADAGTGGIPGRPDSDSATRS
ncbi:hypothetical protein ACOZ4B_10055 [Haloferax prahovense]|uniref:hypothetical protein n=1 Tax=Haloferax prahovense TaxID=381852 RepID=UPI003C777B0F